ncbi:allatostatin-A receptor-like [Acropora millepora]|uniref:allatostatin-A receptor-like n=1 Tax=Acropora millepora TaxID=45264 RepID=UPI001CF36B42|nr:allatostatin-A receptor-like [Acropora millepora]
MLEMALGLRIIFGIIASFAIINNGLLLLVICKNKVLLKMPYNMLVLSLAVTDFITGIGIFITPVYVVGQGSIPIPDGWIGHVFCRVIFSQYLVFTLGIVSVYTVACMAIDRWLAVARPTKYRTILTKSRVNICVLCIWTISVLLNTPHLFEMKAAAGPGNIPQCKWIVLTEGVARMIVAVVEFMGKFFLPLLTASVTMISLHSRVKSSQALFRSNRGQAGLRLLRMCMLTTLILGVCWFPNQLYYLLFKYDLTQLDTPMHHFTVVLCMFNSCINPIVYCISNKTYRRYFMILLCPRYKERLIATELTGSEAASTVYDRISKARPEARISVANAIQAHAFERNGGINNDQD